MAHIPRGIQEVKWSNKTSRGTQIRYRVRIKRKTIKADRLFESLDEAVEFLQLSKSKNGRETIYAETERERKIREHFEDFLKSPPLSQYLQDYTFKYFWGPRGENATETELEKRRRKNNIAFLNILKNTEVEVFENSSDGTGYIGQFRPKRTEKLGNLKLAEITTQVINSYITTRRNQGVKPISIVREINHLSVFFKRLPHFMPTEANRGNPCENYDKSLLKTSDTEKISYSKKREFRLTKQDETTLLKALDKYPNQEMKQIVLLALHTAMRRSEILTLTWDQIKDNHIQLWITKSGAPRKVHLNQDAKAVIATVKKRKNDEKLFTYTISGFEGSFSKFKETIGLKHLRFHDLRRESISRLVEQLGGMESSILATELIGYQSISHFERNYLNDAAVPNTETGIQKSVGHRNKAMTKKYTVLKN